MIDQSGYAQYLAVPIGKKKKKKYERSNESRSSDGATRRSDPFSSTLPFNFAVRFASRTESEAGCFLPGDFIPDLENGVRQNECR